MAIGDDFSIATNGDIRHTSGSDTYTVIEFHEWLQGLADDAAASGNDFMDIVEPSPSDRSTDNIINLINGYNIDDDAAEYIYAGSITQASGDVVYSGLRVLGAVNDSSTQLMVIQDNDLYQFTTTPASPFWGTQSGGGYNGDAAAGVLMRCLIKSRVDGADIDGKRIRVQARHWGDTYDFFNVTLGTGESVAAIGTTPDAQNDTTQGTVTAYTHVTNTEGYQTIDLNNGNGPEPYYSEWTYGADTSGDQLKGVWEFGKDLTGNGTAKTIHGLNGELFLGVTHEFDYDGEAGSGPSENDVAVWGTSFAYDAELSSGLTVGEYYTFGTSGAVGKLLALDDNGTTGNVVFAIESGSGTVVDNDAFTRVDGTANDGATTNGTINDPAAAGGEGLVLADDATDTLWIQLLTGTAPADNLPVYFANISTGVYDVANTADVNGSFTSRTVPKVFLGSYTGTLIGSFGLGVESGDLTANDTIQDLLGVTQTPPNNVTFTVSGLVSGDRVLVTNDDAGSPDLDQLSLNTALTGGAETSVVVTASIPADTPSTGTIRIERDNGQYTRHAYTSWTGSTFTIGSTDFSTNNASASNNVFISYLDLAATGASEAFTTVFSSTRTLFVRVRDGGPTPIKPFESTGTLGSGGGSATAIRTSDT